MDLNTRKSYTEVTEAFLRYQGAAVDDNDVEVMNLLFWTSSIFTVRFGPNGTLHRHDAIAAFRMRPASAGCAGTLRNTVITTFGRDFAATNTESDAARPACQPAKPGLDFARRQGWRIAAAHVSEQPGLNIRLRIGQIGRSGPYDCPVRTGACGIATCNSIDKLKSGHKPQAGRRDGKPKPDERVKKERR